MISKVTDRIFRGPDILGESFYAEHKFQTVINLQTGWWECLMASEDTELIECYLEGIQYYDFTLSQFLPPRNNQIAAILSILKHGSSPIYIHCRHGHERTGFVIAIYRMQECGWPFEMAYAEWKAMGCHWPWHWLWKNALRKWSK